MQTEFVRSLNCNYARILLEEKPEEKRYQYCILSRGGIRGLLPCSLRYINGEAYLYYDISSKQNIKQLYGGRCITRAGVTDFMWSFRQIEQELGRFLLDRSNILWYPQQIYQDLESNVFSFMYFPYHEGDSGFKDLLEFWVEQIDYDDEALVDCVYQMYEQYERNGEIYLQAKIYEDVKKLEDAEELATRIMAVESHRPVEASVEEFEEEREKAERGRAERERTERGRSERGRSERERTERGRAERERTEREKAERERTEREKTERERAERGRAERENAERKEAEMTEPDRKKHIFSIFEGKKKREREIRDNYRQIMQEHMNGYAVAEETPYEEEYGRTIYLEGSREEKEKKRELCTPEGRILAELDRPITTIGKRKEEADIVLEDMSVSRLHARIVKEKETYYIEDLNATNGTFKNGLQLQPYERRELEPEDEIRVGRVLMVFR